MSNETIRLKVVDDDARIRLKGSDNSSGHMSGDTWILSNVMWENIVGKPSAYPPAEHTHPQYLTEESDPTVPAWAKEANKPEYTAAEVGALPASTFIPTKTSDLTNDSGFLTEHQSLEDYATKNWVEDKGYLTEHQSLAGYAKESWVNSQGFLKTAPVTSVNQKTGDVVLTGADINYSDTDNTTVKDAFDRAALLLDDTYALALGNNASIEELQGNKQDRVTASGILKGDGNGGVSAAVAGTDYQTPIPANTYDAYGAAATVQGNLDDVTELIPTAATASNQLADKAFVNSSIGTNTAYFKGTFNSVAELNQQTATNNDYAFVISTDSAGNTVYNRYKYDGSSWVFEYALNNSSFTAEQWAAIQSGITSTLVGSYSGHVANNDIHVTAAQKTAWSGKQDAINDLSTIRSNASTGANHAAVTTGNPHQVTYQQLGGTKPSYTASEVGADASGTAASAVSTHNSSASAHSSLFAAKQDVLTAGDNIDITNDVISVDGIVPNAALANGIPYGQVDSTSTATEYTATVPGINQLKDGVCVLLKNGVVTSESGFTININGLGAKPSYTNLAAATRDTTIFNIGYTMLFIYDEDRVSGGCWICYRGYDANTNTIGYQLRTNSSTLHAADKGYGYRLWFTSANGSEWVPANKSTSTDSTTSRTPNTTPINPFGPIVYNSTNGTVQDGAALPKATLWQQYAVTIGYSFNEPNGAMTFPAPVYLKCTPQSNGSAVMVGLVQSLPSTNDGYIYIFLGRAYSATAMELTIEHPVFYHDGTAIRLWTGAEGLAPLIGSTANTTPTQVLAALQAGKNVFITHTDAAFGNISFTSFVYSANLNAVLAQAVVRVFTLTAVTLTGNVSTDTWALGSDTIEYDPIVQYIHVNGGDPLPNINNGVDITIPTKTSDLTNDSGFITSAPVTSVNGQTGAVTGLQTTGNLVTSVSASSTNSQYPSAKLFYDTVGNIEALLAAI